MKYAIKTLFTIIFIWLLVQTVYAQDNDSGVRQYEIITDTNENGFPKRYRKIMKNVIKFDVAQVAVGEFGLFYERRINKSFTLETGLGGLYQNFWGYGFLNIFWYKNTQYETFVHNPQKYIPQFSVSYSAAAKWFPGKFNNLLDGFFCGLTFRQRFYSWERKGQPDGFHDRAIVSDFMVPLGFTLTGVKGFFFETLIWVGGRFIICQSYSILGSNLPTTPNTATSIDEKTWAPVLGFGLRFGCAF